MSIACITLDTLLHMRDPPISRQSFWGRWLLRQWSAGAGRRGGGRARRARIEQGQRRAPCLRLLCSLPRACAGSARESGSPADHVQGQHQYRD
mmetsp:Transcript_110926/g.313793  ORF Transcript_110926/g.313793 Transcript_110926/m.313793 type:complete len:93 (-) Transcript_110926:566-844(-)